MASLYTRSVLVLCFIVTFFLTSKVTTFSSLSHIKIASFGEIIDGTGDGDKFFKAKVTFIALDESSGKEKKTSVLYLIQSESLEAAESDLKKYLSDPSITISSITETAILDVFTCA